MSINSRSSFITAASSEKITLAHVNAKARLYVFSGPISNIYTKTTAYFVEGLKQDNTDLIKVAAVGEVVLGTFHYDIETSLLSIRLNGDIDPTSVEVIATYKFFYADKGIQLPHDLEDISEDVNYEGRIVSSPGYKHKIGINQALTSLVGEGTLQLKNQDAGLDDIFDTLIFENQDVVIFSWNPNLQPSDARVIYRGRVTNKTFDGLDVKLKIKDQIFNLLEAPNMEAYSASDNVAESVQGRYKRRVYGRVDGLRAQSTDQIADGITLTGTLSITGGAVLLSGNGTIFLTEVLQGDTINIGTQEFTVDEVLDDTSITVSDQADFGAAGQEGILIPQRGTVLRNRTFLAAGHVCAEVTHTVVNVLQFNRVVLDDTSGLFGGDFIEFTDTGERLEIKTVAPGNLIVLQQNMVTKPATSTTAVRRPIQEVFVGNRRVNADDYAVFNTSTGTGVTLQDDVEFNLARSKNTIFDATFTNGTRTITVATNEVSLIDIFEPGDFVKPDNVAYTTFYKIVNVKTQSLDIAVNFADVTTTDTVELKKPDYLTDDSIVSVNILGRTIDGTASGTWIQTAAEAEKDLLLDVGITQVNTQSFTDGAIESRQLISIALPLDFTSKTLPTIKDITDRLNKSVRGSLTLDNSLLIKYQPLNVSIPDNIIEIKDSDIIDWKIKSTNGKTFKTVQGRYRFTDVELSTLEKGNKFFSFDSEFVERYIGTTKIDELNLYLYEAFDAQIAVRRHTYYNRLGVATINITTDLRLEDIEIGDVVIADLQRLYKRFGDSSFRKKTMLVVGKTLTGQRSILELSDLGNTFNTSSFITPNTAPDFSAATSDEKLIYGYITDNQGIVDNDEDTARTHLIS